MNHYSGKNSCCKIKYHILGIGKASDGNLLFGNGLRRIPGSAKMKQIHRGERASGALERLLIFVETQTPNHSLGAPAPHPESSRSSNKCEFAPQANTPERRQIM